MYDCIRDAGVDCKGCGDCPGTVQEICELCGCGIGEEEAYCDTGYETLCADCLLGLHIKYAQDDADGRDVWNRDWEEEEREYRRMRRAEEGWEDPEEDWATLLR